MREGRKTRARMSTGSCPGRSADARPRPRADAARWARDPGDGMAPPVLDAASGRHARRDRPAARPAPRSAAPPRRAPSPGGRPASPFSYRVVPGGSRGGGERPPRAAPRAARSSGSKGGSVRAFGPEARACGRRRQSAAGPLPPVSELRRLPSRRHDRRMSPRVNIYLIFRIRSVIFQLLAFCARLASRPGERLRTPRKAFPGRAP